LLPANRTDAPLRHEQGAAAEKGNERGGLHAAAVRCPSGETGAERLETLLAGLSGSPMVKPRGWKPIAACNCSGTSLRPWAPFTLRTSPARFPEGADRT